MNKTVVANVLIGVAGLGAGFAVGYTVAKKRMTAIYEEEIQSVKDTYSNPLRKEGIFATPEGAVRALVPEDEREYLLTQGESLADQVAEAQQLVVDNSYSMPEMETPSLEQVAEVVESTRHNFWDEINQSRNTALEDLQGEDAEMPDVDEQNPYIIKVGQFMGTEDSIHEDSKFNLTFFEEDEVLVDERETIVPNVDELVGLANLHQFGRGSEDKNVVYVRNHRMESDYEIIRDKRSFQEVVLGQKPEKSGPLRMRDDDQ